MIEDPKQNSTVSTTEQGVLTAVTRRELINAASVQNILGTLRILVHFRHYTVH